MDEAVAAHLEGHQRRVVVGQLRLLHQQDVRLGAVEPLEHAVHAGLERVDVPGRDAHQRPIIGRDRVLAANAELALAARHRRDARRIAREVEHDPAAIRSPAAIGQVADLLELEVRAAQQRSGRPSACPSASRRGRAPASGHTHAK